MTAVGESRGRPSPGPGDQPHRWRSPLLGEALTLELPQGRLDAFRRGEGPPLVFAHGWLANPNLWRGVVDLLAGHFTCHVLDLPLGAHRTALDPGADLSAAGVGELLADAVAALDVEGATLIGNDSGGAYSQIALARRPQLAERLVLTSCETPYDEFPPPPFDGLSAAAADPARLRQLLAALEDPAVRKLPAAFGLLAKHPLDPLVSDSYALPCLRDEAVLRDTAAAMAGASTETMRVAGARLVESWRKPTLLVWPAEDPVFSPAHARRYAAELSDARLVEIEDSYSFTPEDRPDALAAAIAEFAAP
jgi:pimeloyl-ACP methyl ester carboxylesterase